MRKVFIFFLCLAACQLAYSFPQEDDDAYEVEPVSPEDAEEIAREEVAEMDEAEERAFWNVAFNLLKKVLRIEPLKCRGASCSGCLGVFGKGGCFKIEYNKLPSKRAEMRLELSVNNRPRWTGHIKAGRAIPSCINFKGPIKVVCIQDFTCSVAENAIPTGDICFTINFKNYRLGVNFCGYFAYVSFVPLIIPSIKRT